MNVALTVDERTSPTTNAQSCLCVTLHDIMADAKWMCIARVILPHVVVNFSQDMCVFCSINPLM